MPDQFYVRREVNRLVNQMSMPELGPQPKGFASKLEQMKTWIVDPVLRADAAIWATRNGYEVIYDDYGNPVGLEEIGSEESAC